VGQVAFKHGVPMEFEGPRKYLQLRPSRGMPTISFEDLRRTSGRWYYEVEIMHSRSHIQVGWANDAFRCAPLHGSGVGDDRNSWSFGGASAQKFHGGGGIKYGRDLRAGDVIGCAINMADWKITFGINGDYSKPFGKAFNIPPTDGMRPAVSISYSAGKGNTGHHVRVRTGSSHSPFRHRIPAGYSALSAPEEPQPRPTPMSAVPPPTIPGQAATGGGGGAQQGASSGSFDASSESRSLRE